MQGNNIFYKRINRFKSNVSFVEEEYKTFDFNNNLKSDKIEDLEFTNYLSSNQCKKYSLLLNICKNLYNNCDISKSFIADEFNWNKYNSKRVQDIINAVNNKTIKSNALVYKLKHRKDPEIQFYVLKEKNSLKLYLIDVYHLAIEAVNAKTGKADRKGIYKARKNNSFDIKEIQRQLHKNI